MYTDLPPAVRVYIALAMFSVAAAVDMKKREVDDRLWPVFAGPSTALYFLDYGNFDLLSAILSAGLGAGASYALYRTGLFGGAGKEKERVTSGRGMGTVELAYTSRKIVATVVDSERVEDVVDAMRGVLGGQSGGVLVISPVDDIVRL